MAERLPFSWRAADVRAFLPRSAPARHRESFRELKLKIAALEQERTSLHAAVFEAAQVHRRLCAPRLVRHRDFEIASEIFAVRYLPGDFFTIEESDRRVLLALGDVCGKGISAGMWTSCLVGLVRAHAAACPEPDAIVTGVNRELCRIAAPLTSLFLVGLDLATGTLDYCSAGHPPALILRADGQLESLAEGGFLLGMAPDAIFLSGRVTMRAGDMFLAYTDGIVESCNGAEEEFGPARLEAQLRLAGAGTADAVLFSILGAVQDFAAAQALVDDMSLVVVRRRDDP
jgi:sigma-B regulation protein RsbU (phosphoserine phosphatase)